MPRRPAPATLGDRLARARRARFVGRAAELARFDRMLAGQAEPVWFLHGPGGIGKTTLLAEFARRAEAAGRIVLEIDARHVAATPAGWRQALDSVLAAEAAPGGLPPPGSVLLVDTFEAVSAIELWLRDHELPNYPDNVLVLLAGRSPADVHWRLDAGWADVAVVSTLAPWSEAEARDYLLARLGEPSDLEGLLQRGAGVPLLLALLADARRQGRSQALPDADTSAPAMREPLVRELMARFDRELTDPMRRDAFGALVIARSLTLPLLTDVVSAGAAQDLYDWLSGLPFVQEGEHGLQIHDLVRASFSAVHSLRDPAHVKRLQDCVMQHVIRRTPLLGREDATRHLKDWFFLLQRTASGDFLDHRHLDSHYLDHLQPKRDATAVLDLVRQRLGRQCAASVAHWLQQAPGMFRVSRSREGAMTGVIMVLELTELPIGAIEADPVVARVWRYVQEQRAPRPKGSVWCVRLTLDAAGDDLPNPTATLGGMWMNSRTLLEPRADWNVMLHHNTEPMAALYATLTRFNWQRRTPALDHETDGRTWWAWTRDFVTEPVPAEWRPPVASPTPGEAPALDRDSFAAAVRDGLRHYLRDEQLAASPLRHCLAFTQGATAPAPPVALRAALSDAVQALAHHPADLKFHRALQQTWLTPGAKQEAVAADLGLPFNTYRYHLARGAERVAQALWQREQLARQSADTAGRG